MNNIWKYILLFTLALPLSCRNVEEYDVVVVGGSTSGTSAAIQAARCGAKVLLVEECPWLGGMLTSAGVSATDGNYGLRGGIWAEFRDSLEARYGGSEALKTGWVSNIQFSPAVGNSIFQNMAAREENLELSLGMTVEKVSRTTSGWSMDIVSVSERKAVRKIYTKILVDATELGDIAKTVGVPYRVGMDSRYETGEEWAPEERVDIVQDMTYVLTLQEYEHSVPSVEPDGYDPSEFNCCCRSHLCPSNPYDWSPAYMMAYGKLPGGKYMINWPLHGNDFYCNIIDMSREERESVLEAARQKSLRFLYFLQTELGFTNLGLAENEYATKDKLPFYPYYRESRRIYGEITFTLNDIIAPYNQDDALYRTAIASGDYPVDQHHNSYSGIPPLPQLSFPKIPSYGLPLGVMIPKGFENLLVIEKSISVTNIVNGTTRLQPVVLQLGQAAGVLAAEAAKLGCTPSKVSVRRVQTQLLEDGVYLLPLLDAAPYSPEFVSVQKIALTGILKYFPRHHDWVNESWLDADKSMCMQDLAEGLEEFYSQAGKHFSFGHVNEGVADIFFVSHLFSIILGITEDEAEIMAFSALRSVYDKDFVGNTNLTRGECAVLLDKVLDPFGTYEVNLNGSIL